jgi:hypothetical protein
LKSRRKPGRLQRIPRTQDADVAVGEDSADGQLLHCIVSQRTRKVATFIATRELGIDVFVTDQLEVFNKNFSEPLE